MEIAGDLIAATSKVTGLRAKACSSSLARLVCKTSNSCTALAQSTGSFAACKPVQQMSATGRVREFAAVGSDIRLVGYAG